ncbi:MAG TPA: hypothetical protein VM434_00040 [Beijerinckiaceae bacterium]|nr:hypothetical protein [Beijerinckiaceae bacterium]
MATKQTKPTKAPRKAKATKRRRKPGLRSGPGRPEFVATSEQRIAVERYVACGMRHDDIARAIGVSHPTLRKHFADELRTGPAKQRAAVIERLFNSAFSGNVSAQKHLERMTASGMAEASIARTEAGDAAPAAPAAPKRQPRLGKKEAAKEAAKNAGVGSEWGDDLRPQPFQVVAGGKS